MLFPPLPRLEEKESPRAHGCLPHVDRNQRLTYYRDIISVFDENTTAYCNWEYKGDFGIYTFDFKKNVSLAPDTDLIHILTKK